MAFTFPDPSLTPEFEGDNGITYLWDDVDNKWIVKGFSNDGDIENNLTSRIVKTAGGIYGNK